MEDFVELEGIKCVVKNKNREGITKYYQQNLREEIDKYIGNNVMTDSKNNYVEKLEVNIKTAPFVLGWLHKPKDPDEYRVVKGVINLEDLESIREKNKKAASKKTASKKRNKK